jgi:phosphatidylglycerophosphate synthase
MFTFRHRPTELTMAQRFTLAEIRERTYKERDAWWTVWLVDPLASRLVRLVAPYRWVTPNLLTMGAFLLGLGAAACFALQDYRWLIAGAVLFHVSFVLDCMDGKIARLNDTGSVFGAWLDYVFDRLRVLICTVALMGGQYARTGDFVYIWLAGAVIFLDMFRYLNALQMGKVKDDMRANLAAVRGEDAERPAFVEETTLLHPEASDASGDAGDPDHPVVDVYSEFRNRFSLFTRVRNLLVRQRIRVHLVSGIEFQMAVFIVGPLTGWIVGATVVSGALLIAFELLLIFKLWTATRSYLRVLAKARAAAAAGPRAAGTPGMRTGAEAFAGSVPS